MPRLRRKAHRRATEEDPLQAILGDATGAERVFRFFRGVLRHGKGEWAGKPFDLLPFQEEIIRGLYDPTNAAGLRAIRNGLVFLPRKNGKTSLAAGLALYETYCQGIAGRVVVAANSRDQAGELFTAAADAVDASPILSGRSRISRATKRITDLKTRSTFRALAAESGTAHGQDLTFWIYDELHAAPNRDLFDTLATSTGARAEALGLVISTAGFDREHSILGEVYNHAKRCLADPSIDRSFYAYLAEANNGEPWDAEETWRKTNPALGVFRNLDEMRIAADRAREIPGQVAAFQRLYNNTWTTQESRWLAMEAWDRCGDDIEVEPGAKCFAGLDLSSTTDLTALVLVFPTNGRLVVKPFFWIPDVSMRQRENRDRVPYQEWARRGAIEATPGDVVDYKFVLARIIQLAQTYRIKCLNFDSWGSAQLVQELQSEWINVVKMGQGFASMSAPTKRLQELVLTSTIAHGGHPVLRWNCDCATVMSDPAGNIKIIKQDRLRSSRRVDGMVATVMAIQAWMQEPVSVEAGLEWL